MTSRDADKNDIAIGLLKHFMRYENFRDVLLPKLPTPALPPVWITVVEAMQEFDLSHSCIIQWVGKYKVVEKKEQARKFSINYNDVLFIASMTREQRRKHFAQLKETQC